MVALTAHQFLGRDLDITHESATGGALLCEPATTLRGTVRNQLVNQLNSLVAACPVNAILRVEPTNAKYRSHATLRLGMNDDSLTPSLGILARLSRPILDQKGTLHVLIRCSSTSRSKPKMS